jgi:hypothetical protein
MSKSYFFELVFSTNNMLFPILPVIDVELKFSSVLEHFEEKLILKFSYSGLCTQNS